LSSSFVTCIARARHTMWLSEDAVLARSDFCSLPQRIRAGARKSSSAVLCMSASQSSSPEPTPMVGWPCAQPRTSLSSTIRFSSAITVGLTKHWIKQMNTIARKVKQSVSNQNANNTAGARADKKGRPEPHVFWQSGQGRLRGRDPSSQGLSAQSDSGAEQQRTAAHLFADHGIVFVLGVVGVPQLACGKHCEGGHGRRACSRISARSTRSTISAQGKRMRVVRVV